jgi:HEAT repeat protein
MDEAQIIDALRSKDIRLAIGLDEAARITKALTAESIRAFIESETRFPIAARLFKFGPSIIPMLKDLLNQPIDDDDARNHTAALLLELGSKTGVPHLLSILEDNRQSSPMAALVLGKAGIREAGPFIRGVLEKWDCVADPYPAATFVDALKKIDALPDSLKSKESL